MVYIHKFFAQILQDDLVNSFHIGSTSVPGLKAKPITDILLVVKDIGGLDTFSAQFENLGYEVMGEFGIKGRRYFRKGGDDRTHQIHAFQYEPSRSTPIGFGFFTARINLITNSGTYTLLSIKWLISSVL
ncbi:GrpB family protein [Paenibacillus lentus]|uniref:GrpB family protein n=1 Tax=Paenibacillus lentus TaxID=1338368 RepID=UPI0036509927